MFHNLCGDHHEISAPPLVCARSRYLHTICSSVTQRKDFITQHLRLLSRDTRPSLQNDRMDRAALQTILADLMSARHTIRNRVPRSPDLEYLLMMFELILHWTFATQDSRRSPSADYSRLKWDSQTARLTTPSGSQ